MTYKTAAATTAKVVSAVLEIDAVLTGDEREKAVLALHVSRGTESVTEAEVDAVLVAAHRWKVGEALMQLLRDGDLRVEPTPDGDVLVGRQ